MKPATTYEKQIEILASRGLQIENHEAAIQMLRGVNYYRFTAYALTYKNNRTNTYNDSISFEHIMTIYKFDKKMRHLLLEHLETIEIAFKTHIAYTHAHNYSPLAYKNPDYFGDPEYHSEFIQSLNRYLKDNRDELFVKHYIKKYNKQFTIWIIVEILPFSALSKLFKNLNNEDKKLISKEYYDVSSIYIESWLRSLSNLRNICAHHSRLYDKTFKIAPKLRIFEGEIDLPNSTSLFALIIVLKKLLPERDARIFSTELNALIEEYSKAINLNMIGFPQNWFEQLDKIKISANYL